MRSFILISWVLCLGLAAAGCISTDNADFDEGACGYIHAHMKSCRMISEYKKTDCSKASACMASFGKIEQCVRKQPDFERRTADAAIFGREGKDCRVCEGELMAYHACTTSLAKPTETKTETPSVVNRREKPSGVGEGGSSSAPESRKAGRAQ